MLFASNQSTSRSQSLRTISIYAAEPCRSFSLAWLCVLMLAGFAWPTALLPTVLLPSARAADLDEAVLSRQRRIRRCIEMTKAEVERGIWHDGWSKLLMRSLMVKGQYAEAAEVYTKVPRSFRPAFRYACSQQRLCGFRARHAEARALNRADPGFDPSGALALHRPRQHGNARQLRTLRRARPAHRLANLFLIPRSRAMPSLWTPIWPSRSWPSTRMIIKKPSTRSSKPRNSRRTIPRCTT